MAPRQRFHLSNPVQALQQQSEDASANGYLQMVDSFDETALTRRVYTESSERLVRQMQLYWRRFCHFLGRSAQKAFQKCSIGLLYAFFHWLLSQRRHSIRAASTLQTYWNTYHMLYKIETAGRPISALIVNQMVGVREQLADEFGLEKIQKQKPIVRAEDMFELLHTLWVSPKMWFEHERQRSEMALLMQLAGITGNRPGALLALRYEQVKVTLLRDPAGGPKPRVIIEITFQETKGKKLGTKDPNTFGIPEVPREPCLLLCPQTILLGLAFADKAFQPDSLTSPEALNALTVPNASNQLLLPWKLQKLSTPLFSGSRRAKLGRLDEVAAWTDDMLRSQLRKLGQVTGIELPVGPYCFRRGAGEALDNSSQISESQRNVILRHEESRTFQKCYSSRYIPHDTQAIYRGLEPQHLILREASGLRRTIDRRQPVTLTLEQKAEIKSGPGMKELNQRKEDLLGEKKRLQKVMKTLHRGAPSAKASLAGRQALRKADAAWCGARDEYRCEYQRLERHCLSAAAAQHRKTQPAIDIERQLQGLPVDEGAEELDYTKISYAIPQRRRAIAALLTFAPNTPAEELKNRIEAINAVAAVSSMRESRRPQNRQPAVSAAPPRETPQQRLKPPFEPTQCIFCYGDESIAPEDLRPFGRRTDTSKHVRKRHLPHFAPGQYCPHPQCDATLDNVDHLRNHLVRIHDAAT